jgi:hypothetical protein
MFMLSFIDHAIVLVMFMLSFIDHAIVLVMFMLSFIDHAIVLAMFMLSFIDHAIVVKVMFMLSFIDHAIVLVMFILSFSFEIVYGLFEEENPCKFFLSLAYPVIKMGRLESNQPVEPSYTVVSVPSLDFQRHMSLSFLCTVNTIKMRSGCSVY